MIPWFERRFDTAFPQELLPSLYARLRGTPARLEDLLAIAPREVLTRRVEGKWSAQENAGHLLELEPLWLARVEDYAAARLAMTPVDLSNQSTGAARYNDRSLGEVLSAFRAARQDLLHRVATLKSVVFQTALPHPRLGTPLRLPDHLHFVAEHDDHHLARIFDLTRV